MSTKGRSEVRGFVDDCLDKAEQAVPAGGGFAPTDNLLQRRQLGNSGPRQNGLRRAPAITTILVLAGLLAYTVMLLTIRSGTQAKSADSVKIVFTQGLVPLDLSPASDEQWDSLLPVDNGFIYADVPDGPRNLIHGISMFHQLHCLRMIRDVLQDFEGLGNETQQEAGHVPRPNVHLHTLHCFDYLVQGILCAADGTLEPALENNRTVNGYDVAHQCQDKDRLWRMVEASHKQHRHADGA